MAEISCGGHVESAALEGDWRPWCDDCHYAVRARLAEVEAERDVLRQSLFNGQDAVLRGLEAEARLAEVETARDKALNQARHWREQEAKQRRLRHEEGRWKHRALQAELNASDLPGLRARLTKVEALHSLRNNWGPSDDFCATCRYDWPCPTIRAARGDCEHDSDCVLLYGDGPDAPAFCECRNCCQRCGEGDR